MLRSRLKTVRKGAAQVLPPNFWLPLSDAGNGAVNLALSRGTGSATFTRATAATTVLSTGLIANVSSGVARSYYDPAPTGGQGSYMYLPGVSGAYASTPDSAAVSVTGDIDIRADLAPDSWTPAAVAGIVSKIQAGTSGYMLLLSTLGRLILYVNGSGVPDATSSASVPFTAGQRGWVRCTKDTSTGAVNFYTSSDGKSWTALGTPQTGAVAAINDNTLVLEIGRNGFNTAQVLSGKVYRVQVYNGINGTLVADFDPARTTQASTSFAASTGETWTINGRGFIYAAPSYRGYLAEEARTNLVLRSSDFSLAWTAVGTPTRSAAAKTCGSVNLDLIGDDSAAALEGYTQTITYTGNATKVVSLFVAQGTSTSTMVRLRDTTAVADRLLAAITWSAGAPTLTMTTGTSLGAQPFPDGVWRVSFLTAAVTAANVNSLEVYPASDAALAVANTGDIYAGGVESNDAAFSTSHIPTAAAASTRAADVMTFASAGNVSSTAGTAFARATKFVDSSTAQTLINAGGASEYPMSTGGSTNSVAIFDGTNVASSGATFTGTSTFRVASVWGSNIKISLNATFGSSNSFDGSMGFGANIGIGARTAGDQQFNGCIRDIRIWQRVLSDSQIASIR